jgi:hypothetical protein
MSYWKEKQMDDARTEDLIEFLKVKIERDELLGAVSGITKQLMDKGIESLKGKQKPKIESFVEKYRQNLKCEICSNGNVEILMDYLYVEDNGICPTCEYDRDKYFRNNP